MGTTAENAIWNKFQVARNATMRTITGCHKMANSDPQHAAIRQVLPT